ncbi:hypothetical protein [Streptococcus pneumoniae]|uniref:hypothetical protein n=1 Tax=Streptococcus pneumoniae TaxID=1313 RepID=UPI0029549FA0|nr:hypothetical protein [Streptococcus pneumoniae]
MPLPTGKIDLNEYGKHLAEKSAEIYKEKTKQAVDAMERHIQECLARDAKWQAVIDRSDELLKEKKEREHQQEIERLMEEKRKEVDREVSQRLSMPNEHQKKLNKAMSEMLKDLF